MDTSSNFDEIAPLVDVIERGDIESLEDLKRTDLKLFQKGIELYGGDLIKCALRHNHFQIASYLLDCNCGTKTGDDDPPLLHQVATNPNAASFIRKLLVSNNDVNETDLFDYTPLHWACESGISRNVEALLEHGARCDVKNSSGEMPLHLAVRHYHVDCVRLLLAAGADANVRVVHFRVNVYFWTPHERIGRMPLDFMMHDIFDAFSKCKPLDVMRALCISRPFSVEEVLFNLKSLKTIDDESDLSLNNWDLIERQLQIVHLLLKFDGVLVSTNEQIECPVKEAFPYSQILLEIGANPNFDIEDGSPSLIQAFRRTDFALTKLLMKYGTNPNIVTAQLSYLLMDELKHYPSLKSVDLLLELGADINVKDSSYEQSTPLHLVTNYYHVTDLNVKLLEKLSKKTDNIDPLDSEGYTPLMRAIVTRHYNIKLVKLFLELNADTTVVNHNGNSLWSLVIKRCNPRILNFFMEYGLDLDMDNVFNRSSTIIALIDMDIPHEKAELLSVRNCVCNEKVNVERRVLVASFVRDSFLNTTSDDFKNLYFFLVEYLRGSPCERKFCCSIATGAATFFVEAENYLLRKKATSLSEYHLARLLGYRLEMRAHEQYREALRNEIRSMEDHIFWRSLTLYQLFQIDFDNFPAFLKTVDIRSIEAILSLQLADKVAYPILSDVIEKHLHGIIAHLHLLRGAANVINSIFFSTRSWSSSRFSTLPDHIVDLISSHLSKSDLTNLMFFHWGMNEDLLNNLRKSWWHRLNYVAKGM